MATHQERQSVAREDLQRTASHLLRCTHPDEHVVGPRNTKWCGRCGALHSDGKWVRPSLVQDDVSDALAVIGKR